MTHEQSRPLPDGPRKPSLRFALALMALVAVVVSPGCSSIDEGRPTWWHDAVVVRTMSRSDLPAGIDAACARAPADSASRNEADRFALVRFRVGRAPYPMLFPLAAEDGVQAGDHVHVEPATCELKPTENPGG